jgi:exodeoxyribonuclease-1
LQTYLFYDIETTGLSKAFDQVLQFAAIRTDLNLKELNRYELKVKLNPDVVPAPRAVITHHIGVKESLEGISEIEAIKQIHTWMNEPGTISLGYNTLGFDDEFLRFSFYRHLLPPYTHQYANQCSRMDLYPMTVMYYLFKNHLIQWPQKNNKLSLKLEDLNHANQFIQGQAHQAIVDVEATVALAARFHDDKEMWNYLASYFNKQKDEERVRQLQGEPGLLIEGFFGEHQRYQCAALPLGNHRHYKNQSLWLRLDTEELPTFTKETLKESTRVTFKKTGEPGFVLPFKARFLQHLSTERTQLVEKNLQWLQANPDSLAHITQYYSDYLYPTHPHVDTQASLYLHGFWNEEETLFCRRFHAVNDPHEKALMTENVKNPRLKQLARRLLGKHYPEALIAAQQHYFQDYLQQINPLENTLELTDHQGKKRLTVKDALQDIGLLREGTGLSTAQLSLLSELEQYLLPKA